MISKQLSGWMASPLGREMMGAEHERVSDILSNIYGQLSLEIRASSCQEFVYNQQLRVCRCLLSSPTQMVGDLQCDLTHLPFQDKGFDLILVYHGLEFIERPETFIAALNECLCDGGVIVFVLFNPFSLWGLVQKIMPSKALAVSDPVRFVSSQRLKKYCKELKLDCLIKRHVFFRLPVQSVKWLQRLEWMETFGKRFLTMFSASYICVAHKTRANISPIRMRDHFRTRLVATGLPEQSANICQSSTSRSRKSAA